MDGEIIMKVWWRRKSGIAFILDHEKDFYIRTLQIEYMNLDRLYRFTRIREYSEADLEYSELLSRTTA